MMPGGSPGMSSPQFLGQQGYMQQGLYGRPPAGYPVGPSYGGR